MSSFHKITNLILLFIVSASCGHAAIGSSGSKFEQSPQIFPPQIRGSGQSRLGPLPHPDDFVRTVKLATGLEVTYEVYFSMETIVFEVTAATAGNVGFGVSNTNGYPADVVIGGVHSDATPYFTDYKATGAPSVSNLQLSKDSQQDWNQIDLREEWGNTTILKFVRRFNTQDTNGDFPITDKQAFFFWIMGTSDTMMYNDQREFFGLNILHPRPFDNFVKTLVLSEEHTFSVTWTVNFVTEKVSFSLTAGTKGHVGFGLSHTGNLTSTDLIIGGVADNFVPYFHDYFTADDGVATIDEIQDWQFLGASELGSSTTLRFIRSFDTHDENGDIPIRYLPVYLEWFIGSMDTVGGEPLAQGRVEVNILQE